jgi:hypothetical protein
MKLIFEVEFESEALTVKGGENGEKLVFETLRDGGIHVPKNSFRRLDLEREDSSQAKIKKDKR